MQTPWPGLVIVGTPVNLDLLGLSTAAHLADWSLGLSNSYVNLCVQKQVCGFAQPQLF